jgi:protein involved in polysaccharide export with SLBB domain
MVKKILVFALAMCLVFQPLLAAAADDFAEQSKPDDRERRGDTADQTQQEKQGKWDRRENAENESPYRILEGEIDPDQYVLGPFDELLMILRGSEDKVVQLRVLPEGNVILPNVGPFKAAGMTLSAFKQKLVETLSRYYHGIEIDCQLAIPRMFRVYVLGEVKRPGPVDLHAPFRISAALDQAGGVNDNGSLRRIELREDGRVVRKVDLFAFMRLGRESENVILKEGQTIYVPPRKDVVRCLGEVQNPGEYEILPGETVGDLIMLSGGFLQTADTDHIVIESFADDDELKTEEASFSSCKDRKLDARDGIMVPDRMSYRGARFVRVLGGGGRTGIFYIKPGEKLKEFLLRVGRFEKDFDLSRAVLERKAGEGKREFIRFDINSILKGDPSGEIELENEDIITIPSVESMVYVGGEVKQPGEVPYYAGFTAERYIGLAGGPTENGSFDHVTIFSIEGKKRKGKSNSQVLRGETIIVGKKMSRVLASAFLGIASVTGLVISLIALSKK